MTTGAPDVAPVAANIRGGAWSDMAAGATAPFCGLTGQQLASDDDRFS